MPSTVPAYWTDVLRRGADYSEPFILRSGSANGDPIDLMGAAVTITVRPRFGEQLVYTSVATPSNVVLDRPNGTVTFVLSEAETAAYPQGGHGFVLRVQFADGTTSDYIDGILAAEG